MQLRNSPKIISLFSGAGLFDIGFETAGFEPIFSTDQNSDCCNSLESNATWPVVQSAIQCLKPEWVRKTLSLRKKELELLVGGPPCQPYSKSAYGSLGSPLGMEDSRSSTIRFYFKFVNELLPKVFIIENVPQFISGKNEGVKGYLKRLTYQVNKQNNTNYRLNIFKLNAANFGVPQFRERIFIVGVRSGQIIEEPSITHYKDGDVDLELLPFRTTWDAIGKYHKRLQMSENLSVGGKWGDLLHSIPPGSNYLWHTKRGGGKNIFGWRKRYWNFLLKLHPDAPSWTIAANPGQHTGPFHWDSRKLATNELKALQTVPEDYVIFGSRTSAIRQIGNGVPSAIGELLGNLLLKEVFKQKHNTSLTLIPTKRRAQYNTKSTEMPLR